LFGISAARSGRIETFPSGVVAGPVAINLIILAPYLTIGPPGQTRR
jgi:hypothetical protein